jgi:formylglycine-generating enzyme required for sulfatase activity
VVAIKVLAPALAVTSPARKRFLREARSSAKVRHENVVQVYAVEEKPLPYLVMEFIPGETLQQRLDRIGPLEVPEVVQIGRQIAKGLAAAHEMGLIHRDIKPGNTLIERGPQERVKITDFGLARTADDASLTTSGVMAGTPMFMSPEQARGNSLDHRSDLFSLGSVLYVMCTGRPPFRASNTYAVIKRVAEDDPRPIREVILDVPDWLCRIVARLHAKDPADRFQTAREVADLLADCEAKLIAQQHVPAELVDRAVKPAVRPAPTRRKKWVGAVVLGLIPLVTLAVTELAGVSHVFPRRPAPAATKAGPETLPPTPPTLAVAPFDAARAREHQEAWARYLGTPVEITNSISMKLRLIPPGAFLMGASPDDDQAEPDERPQHRVRLTRPYYLGVTEVTNAQFQKFVAATGYLTAVEMDGQGAWLTSDNTRDPSRTWRKLAEMGANLPVTCVTWKDAEAFCRWLSDRESRIYRLPTDAEWEYACRAGTTTLYYFGNEPDFAQANVPPDGALTSVGSHMPNPFGLHDMHGNAHERVLDGRRTYTSEPITDPLGPMHPESPRVTRGGAATSQWPNVRASHRYLDPMPYANNALGFRVAIVGDLKAKTPSTGVPADGRSHPVD